MTEPLDLSKPAGGWESVHLVEQAPSLDGLDGFHVAEIDSAAITEKEDLMSALSGALEFPDYFGGNWDALDEVLRDLAWIGADGYVLTIAGAGGMWQRAPEISAFLVRAWTDAAAVWSEKGIPFHLVLVR